MWQPDGWDAEVRLGILVPHADVGPESELQSMAPEGVLVHASRVPFGAMAAGGRMDPTIPLAPVAAFVAPPEIDHAVDLLATAPLHGIGIAFTSSAYVVGADAEQDAVERLASRTGEIPVVDTCASAVLGLRALGIERLALVSPPWFDPELDELGAAYFTSQAFKVVRHGPCALPSDQSSITPADLYQAVLTSTPDSAEAVFVGGNGFRSVGVIDALESALERPVLTANQALLWGLLRAAGASLQVSGYGRLLE